MFNQEIGDRRQGLFYALFLLALSGLMGITMTGDAFNLFVFLEISSLSTYALVAMGRSKAAPLSAFRYLIMGTLGRDFLPDRSRSDLYHDRHPEHGRSG